MASFHTNNGIPLSTVLEWYKIRDTFFGFNFVSQNMPLALQLAACCLHPDARWLSEMFVGKDVRSEEDAKQVFLAQNKEDARALCFEWNCRNEAEQEDEGPLRRSAELGYAFAQAILACASEGAEKMRWAKLAAEQGERDGMFWAGECFRYGEGCEKDLNRAKESLLWASRLGCVDSMESLGDMLDETDVQRWHWLGQAAGLGNSWLFLRGFGRQVVTSENATVMFAIGRALQGNVNEEARSIFNDRYDFDSRVGPAKKAIAFYEAQIQATKDAMRAWTQVGIRWKVVKDVRKLIAKLIWDSRQEALFKDSDCV
jgi:hypothetical protein